MKLSQAGIGITRLQNVDSTFPAQDILIQSGQLVQYGAGVYAYNNIPLKLKENIENIVKEELSKSGCIEVSLPTLQPRAIWEKSGRWDKYIENETMLTVDTNKGEYCLAPTAEEAMVEFASTKLKSHKSLPATFFQIGEKYRNEIRTRGYLLRGKTFPMMDAYSFNKNEEDLIDSYKNIKQAYLRIFKRLGLDVVPVVADSGAIGGKKSEEFMMLSDIGEDTILYDENTGIALNTEILERPDYKEYLKTEYGIEDISELKEKKAVELGHIFQLGTKYSEKMNATYTDKDGKEKPFYMGCYGIGISRTLAVIYEKSIVRDEKGNPIGISLPREIAPYFLQIIPKSNNIEKVREANELYELLKQRGLNVILDDRENITVGASIKDCKILGTPYMAVLGDKVKAGEIEIEDTKTGNKRIIPKGELIEFLNKKGRTPDEEGDER